MSDQPRTDDDETPLTCRWCGTSFEPGEASAGVHFAGLDSSRLDCPHQDLVAIVEVDGERRRWDPYRAC